MKIDDMKTKNDIPAIIADHEGIITFINQAFNQNYGWTNEDLIGNPLSTIIPKNMREAHQMGFSRFILSGKGTILNKSMTLKILHKNGQEMDAEHFLVAEKDDSGHWIIGATISLPNQL